MGRTQLSWRSLRPSVLRGIQPYTLTQNPAYTAQATGAQRIPLVGLLAQAGRRAQRSFLTSVGAPKTDLNVYSKEESVYVDIGNRMPPTRSFFTSPAESQRIPLRANACEASPEQHQCAFKAALLPLSSPPPGEHHPCHHQPFHVLPILQTSLGEYLPIQH